MGLQTCGLNLNPARKELAPHGTLAFPCAGYLEGDISRPGGEVPWHWHDELEVVWVASGRLRVQIPATEILLSEGDCMAINSGVLHSASATSPCELRSMVFSPLLLTGSKDSVYATRYLTPLTECRAFRAAVLDRTENDREIAGFALAFDALSRDAPGFEFTVREKLSALCYALYARFADSIAADASPANRDDLRIQKMLEWIHQGYLGDMTLAEIARAADVGQRECLRCFSRTIGLSPMQYLLKYRVMRGAERLLQRPGDSIAEIAAGCGFDSPSYFSKMFKRYYNRTPKEYRACAGA